MHSYKDSVPYWLRTECCVWTSALLFGEVQRYSLLCFKPDLHHNNILTACRIRSEWLETQLEASINEIFEQKQQLEDIVTPIFTKMATPRQVRSPKSVA
ncbi:Ankyrin repeat domain-containing protein 45 [Myotis brandtii]|uniref:Ankyrin repeat domain-containing protein 45 n=1 Tax=Myotis brandtii TaxID=109478 RepID=S7PKN4_MYOBR|nr:Ankyrin repeat domain-containing protein 45 [Myotis brandtii]